MLPLLALFWPWHKHHFLKEASWCPQSRSGFQLRCFHRPYSLLSENLMYNYRFLRVIVWLTTVFLISLQIPKNQELCLCLFLLLFHPEHLIKCLVHSGSSERGREKDWIWKNEHKMKMNISLLKDLGNHKYFFLLQVCSTVFEYLIFIKNVIVLKENLKVKNSLLYWLP